MVELPPEAALMPTATTAFGPATLLCGRLINTAADSHLASTHGDRPRSGWSAPVLKTFSNASSGAAPRRPAVFATIGWSRDDLELLEATARGKLLVARMIGTGGHTVSYFSDVDQLATMLKRCKGEAAFNAPVSDAIRRISRNEQIGGLALNWLQIGFDQRGVLNSICFTCNSSFKVGASQSNGPFHNLFSHCEKGSKHEKGSTGYVTPRKALNSMQP